MMPTTLKILLAALISATVAWFAGSQYGQNLVQSQWDQDKAVNDAIAKKQAKDNLNAAKELEKKHEQDIKDAEKRGARAARWALEHGVLLNCKSDLQRLQSAYISEVKGTGVPDGAGGEQSAWGRNAEFIERCGIDANKVTDWQTLCSPERCEIVD